MLDANTKRRIDTARDILVGKIPDPKSQVEQITIALTYKLMDDMDAISEDLGGERSHFSGDFEKYRWANLTRPGAGGHETLLLYAEAISRMRQNANLPEVFRDIFKNAILPYADPETLRAFLKTIDGFAYGETEPLGDAFEYLLATLASQGDAGQFLTPRHIIDFIVAAVDPKKDETVLDPACGTAGFLISAYKHIQAANADEYGASALTPDDRERLADNFSGYDIAPDMVRLSLLNMYLHGFLQPHIHEYDTLTNEERWSEYADVILANPPFMSPTGGIKPHARFSVKSKRSEVLFVDYIAEHLTPRGRAGIIVPEGVVFRNDRGHRQLRETLVNHCLIAVVSLPAGVFNPYAGVKTSILLLDRALARRTDSIAFFKVENDGYELGDQRRKIDADDLPQALDELSECLRRIRNGESLSDFNPSLGLIVKKARIAADGEYSLAGEGYREISESQSAFPHVALRDIAAIKAGNPAPQGNEYFDEGEFPFIRMSDVGKAHRSDNFIGSADRVNRKAVDELRLRLFPAGTILFPKSGASTFLNHRVMLGEPAHVSSHLAAIIPDKEKASPQFIYRLLCNIDARDITHDQAYPSLRLKTIGDIEIPLPPLEVQREIVAEIAGYQRVADGARAVVENWRPRIAADPGWPVAPLGDIANVIPGQSPPGESYNSDGSGTPFYQGKTEFGEMFIGEPAKWTTAPKRFAERQDILMSVRAPVGPVNLAAQRICIGRGLAAIRPSRDKFHAMYAFYALRSIESEITGSAGATFASINKRDIEKIKIPLPPLETQRAIVAEIEAERSLVDASRELVVRFEAKIEFAVGGVWGG